MSRLIPSEEELQAYVDDRLLPERRREVDRYLAAHPQRAAEQAMHRQAERLARDVPQGDVDSRKRMISLQQIQAIGTNQISDAANVTHIVDSLAHNRRDNRLACAV